MPSKCFHLQRLRITAPTGPRRATKSREESIKKTADGFTYLDPAQFHEYFAADLSAEQAAFMARSQVLNAADNFKAIITTAAWRSKPSWMLVAARDRTINPDLERWYAARAKSRKVEVSGASHSVYVSRPKEVAALIEEAASHARYDLNARGKGASP
jgi:pimeloyl-ACP methyl ester carboxylesterase